MGYTGGKHEREEGKEGNLERDTRQEEGRENGRGRGEERTKGRQGKETCAKFPLKRYLEEDPKREEKTKNPNKKTRKRKRLYLLLFVP